MMVVVECEEALAFQRHAFHKCLTLWQSKGNLRELIYQISNVIHQNLLRKAVYVFIFGNALT